MSRDPHDQLLLRIRGAVAEYERTLISERMRRGRLRKLRAGALLPWTRPPYGYRLDPERPRGPAGVRLDEAEAAVVRDLFTWFADQGMPIYGVQRRLDQLGIVSPRGHRRWNSSALHGVLTNPTYLGQIFANRVRARPAERRRSALLPVGRSGTGATRAVNTPEWIAVAPVPAIISQAPFERAQERLSYNRQMARRNNRVHPYLLRGMVSCGRCRLGCPACICQQAMITMSAGPKHEQSCCYPASAAQRAPSRHVRWRNWSGATCARYSPPLR